MPRRRRLGPRPLLLLEILILVTQLGISAVLYMLYQRIGHKTYIEKANEHKVNMNRLFRRIVPILYIKVIEDTTSNKRIPEQKFPTS